MDDLCRQIEDLIERKEQDTSNHAALEEKLSKAQLEKAKADSKYFSAMRLKEASEAERKQMDVALSSHVRNVQKLDAQARDLKGQIVRSNREPPRFQSFDIFLPS